MVEVQFFLEIWPPSNYFLHPPLMRPVLTAETRTQHNSVQATLGTVARFWLELSGKRTVPFFLANCRATRAG
jgi:hypothetical protein